MANDYVKKRLLSHKKLAQERTVLANERTTLAHVRTSLASFALGFALVELIEKNTSFVYIGYGALIIGAFIILFGIIYYPIRKRKIMSY